MAQKKKKKKKVTAQRNTAPQTAPVENPRLKQAIEALKESNSPAKQQELLDALKTAKLLAPVNLGIEIKPDENGRLPDVKTNEIRFYLINTKDGKTFFPAFTDAAESLKFKVTGENDPKPVNIVRSMDDYWKMLSDPKSIAAGIVLNPGSDNMVIPKPLVGAAAGKISARVVNPQQPANAPVNITYVEPSVYPTRMVNAVYDHCAETPDISRVWLKGKLANGTMSFTLFVEADKNQPDLLNGIQEAAIPYAKDVPVETVFINDKIMTDIIKDAVALYDRDLEL